MDFLMLTALRDIDTLLVMVQPSAYGSIMLATMHRNSFQSGLSAEFWIFELQKCSIRKGS